MTDKICMSYGQQKSQNSAGFIALVCLLSAGILYYLSQNTSVLQPVEQMSLSSKNQVDSQTAQEALVNKYLQETNEKIQIQKMRSRVENSFAAPKVGELVPLKPAKKVYGVDAPEDVSQQKLRGTLAPDVSRDDSSPSAVIEGQLADKQRLEDYDREYRRRYVQAFIENARKNGWNIKVDKNGVVTQSSPIPNFENEQPKVNLFEPSTARDRSGD